MSQSPTLSPTPNSFTSSQLTATTTTIIITATRGVTITQHVLLTTCSKNTIALTPSPAGMLVGYQLYFAFV